MYYGRKKVPPSGTEWHEKIFVRRVTNLYRLLSLPLRAYELFQLSKCIREWRKLGYSSESSTSRKTLSCPDCGYRGVKKPSPNFARFSENGCYMTYFESLLRPRSPLFTVSSSILISRSLILTLLSLWSAAVHFSKTVSPACGNFSHSFFFFLALVALANPRSKRTLPYAPFAVLFFPLVIGIDSCNVGACNVQPSA